SLVPFDIVIFSAFFFLYYPPTTAIQTLSLHDALPIYAAQGFGADLELKPPIGLLIVDLVNGFADPDIFGGGNIRQAIDNTVPLRSEEHTSELQSRENLVCRLLLEKKKSLRTERS